MFLSPLTFVSIIRLIKTFLDATPLSLQLILILHRWRNVGTRGNVKELSVFLFVNNVDSFSAVDNYLAVATFTTFYVKAGNPY